MEKISNFYLSNTAITADGSSEVIQCKGFKSLLLTLTTGTITGTNPSLDIAVYGQDDSGTFLLIDNFPTVFTILANNIHLIVDVENYSAIKLLYDVSGANPSYDFRIMGALSI
jgi:hypothetical protein